MFVLDSDHISIWQNSSGLDYQRLTTRMRALPESSFYWPITSLHEQAMGWHNYIQKARDQSGVIRGYRMFARMLEDFGDEQILPFDQAAAEVFEQMKRRRVRIGTMDLRIASIALSCGFTLLTRNFVDYARVPGLKFEDWTLP